MSDSSNVSTTYASDASSESTTDSSNGSTEQRKSQRLSGVNDSGFVTRDINGSDTDFISSTSTSDNGSSTTPDLSSTSSGPSPTVSVFFFCVCSVHI